MKKNKLIFLDIILFLILLFVLIALFVQDYFGAVTIEQLLFHRNIPLNEPIGNFINIGFSYVFPKLLLIILLYIFVRYIFYKINITFDIHFWGKNIKIPLNKIIYKLRWIIVIILILFCSYKLNTSFSIMRSLQYNNNTSDIYEKYYVNPKKAQMNFPSHKRNLIYIMVESLEATDFSYNQGGFKYKSIIPELEEIANQNINFSHGYKLGGFYDVLGTGFTAGAIVGHTAGIPLIGGIGNNNYNKYESILKNAYSIGEILKDAGYKNYFMMGSDKNFGGRGNYLSLHGNYEIFDFNTAKDLNYIPKDYDIKWWGFEDKKLYQFTKEKLVNISKNDEPFNFTMLTVDTHPIDGYLDETCMINNSLTQYENVFACGSKMLNEFVTWIEKQKFYDNTTIVIVGDHLNMIKKGIYEDMPQNYNRKIYNAFINSSVKTKCRKNREFNTFDIYPTTLAALGVKIKGERLALGTNLFSCQETLTEELGLAYLNTELMKKSNYYNNCLFFGKC
ncbi:MAG: LTA synthase family protein [Bacilli bacterium]|nr:LTA synthase family protein [Bacilli bacterium]